jgi:hypothetical protein
MSLILDLLILLLMSCVVSIPRMPGIDGLRIALLAVVAKAIDSEFAGSSLVLI